jgi:hypothetical protein
VKKTSLLFLTYFLLLFNVSLGQVSLGIKAGLTFSKLKYKSSLLTYSTDYLVSLTFGIPIEIKFSEVFALQPELNFISKGGSQSEKISHYETFESGVKINYFEIPIIAKISILKKAVRLNIIGGPAFAFGLGGNAKGVINNEHWGSVASYKKNIDFEDDKLNSLDVSMNLGISSSFELGSTQFFIEFRYQHGLSNINAPEDTSKEVDFKLKSETPMFNLGYLFSL